MVEIAEGYHPFVADLPSQGPWLCESKMMRLAWSSRTDEAGEGGDEREMFLVAQPSRCRNRECRFVDGGRCRLDAVLRGQLIELLLKYPLEHGCKVQAPSGKEVWSMITQGVHDCCVSGPERTQKVDVGAGGDRLAQTGAECLGVSTAGHDMPIRREEGPNQGCNPGVVRFVPSPSHAFLVLVLKRQPEQIPECDERSLTIVRFERGDELRDRTIEAIRLAFESAGVVFIPENGGGPGVRLRRRGKH